mmetsp:Transcript_18135/g.68546  ORF Transcript_18135/g.68546 Transcript_18135/m.68546 type:complete len:350 (-) Transcript_18135:14642-15691(-)
MRGRAVRRRPAESRASQPCARSCARKGRHATSDGGPRWGLDPRGQWHATASTGPGRVAIATRGAPLALHGASRRGLWHRGVHSEGRVGGRHESQTRRERERGVAQSRWAAAGAGSKEALLSPAAAAWSGLGEDSPPASDAEVADALERTVERLPSSLPRLVPRRRAPGFLKRGLAPGASVARASLSSGVAAVAARIGEWLNRCFFDEEAMRLALPRADACSALRLEAAISSWSFLYSARTICHEAASGTVSASMMRDAEAPMPPAPPSLDMNMGFSWAESEVTASSMVCVGDATMSPSSMRSLPLLSLALSPLPPLPPFPPLPEPFFLVATVRPLLNCMYVSFPTTATM